MSNFLFLKKNLLPLRFLITPAVFLLFSILIQKYCGVLGICIYLTAQLSDFTSLLIRKFDVSCAQSLSCI